MGSPSFVFTPLGPPRMAMMYCPGVQGSRPLLCSVSTPWSPALA